LCVEIFFREAPDRAKGGGRRAEGEGRRAEGEGRSDSDSDSRYKGIWLDRSAYTTRPREPTTTHVVENLTGVGMMTSTLGLQ